MTQLIKAGQKSGKATDGCGIKRKTLNPDLWEEVLSLLEKHDVTLHWVKGHNGHPENEECDRMAVEQSKKI